MDEDDFEAGLTRDGYGAAVAGDYPAGRRNELHNHPFAVRGLVVAGEMRITIGEDTRDYRAGDVFAVAPGELHCEIVGAEGCSYLYGTRPPSV